MEDLPEFANIIESLNEEYDKLYEEKRKERISFMKIIADLENKNNSMINTISQQIVDEVTHSLLEDYEENMDGIDLIKFIEKYDYDKSNRSEIIRNTLEKIKEFNMDVCISNIYSWIIGYSNLVFIGKADWSDKVRSISFFNLFFLSIDCGINFS